MSPIPIVPLDVPEDYAKRVLRQCEAFFLLGKHLPFAVNLNQFIAERRVLFIVYSNHKRAGITFEESDKEFQIVPRDQLAYDTLKVYFQDFIEWRAELFQARFIALDFGDESKTYVQNALNNLTTLQNYPWDFYFSLSEFDADRLKKAESG